MSWEVTRVAVRTTQGPAQTPFPQAELYDSPVPVASSSYGATASGHNDIFDPANDPVEIGPNDAVLIVWTGGIPGTVATVTIRGHSLLERLWDGAIRLSAVRYSPVPLSRARDLFPVLPDGS